MPKTAALTLRGYWGNRPESTVSCASRTVDWLKSLAKHDPLLTGWRYKANSRKQATRPIPLEVNQLATYFDRQRIREQKSGRFVTGDVRLGGWNNNDAAGASFSLSMGADWGGAGLANYLNLELPNHSEIAEPYPPAAALGLVATTATWFDVNYASLFSSQYPDFLESIRAKHEPRLGWVTYLRRDRLARLAELDTDGLTIQVLPQGALIGLGEDPFAITEEQYLDLHARLMAIDALTPIPQDDPIPPPEWPTTSAS